MRHEAPIRSLLVASGDVFLGGRRFMGAQSARQMAS
jgi:hypothetical protein